MSSIDEKGPICECHGRPKLWVKDRRKAKGGYWACRTKLYTKNTRWDQRHYISSYIRKRKFQLKKSKELNLNKLQELINVR